MANHAEGAPPPVLQSAINVVARFRPFSSDEESVPDDGRWLEFDDKVVTITRPAFEPSPGPDGARPPDHRRISSLALPPSSPRLGSGSPSSPRLRARSPGRGPPASPPFLRSRSPGRGPPASPSLLRSRSPGRPSSPSPSSPSPPPSPPSARPQASPPPSPRQRGSALLRRESRRSGEAIANTPPPMTFKVSRVMDRRTTQADVFDAVAADLIISLFNGFNTTIFAYGQTGAGKTHTMFGQLVPEDQRGLIPRCTTAIFTAINKHNVGLEFLIRCSYLEMYMEEVKDLLNVRSKESLQIREHAITGVGVSGLHREVVSREEDIYRLIHIGNKARATSSTKMNKDSSRSHCCFTIYLEQTDSEGHVKTAKLNFVDLAGSERVKKSLATGEVFREAVKINSSLSNLAKCIDALNNNPDGHIPYRDSKLTRFLQDSLGGNCKTSVVVALSPHITQMDETISSLRFAESCARVKTRPRVNLQLTSEELQSLLEAANKELEEIRLHNTPGMVDVGVQVSEAEFQKPAEPDEQEGEEEETPAQGLLSRTRAWSLFGRRRSEMVLANGRQRPPPPLPAALHDGSAFPASPPHQGRSRSKVWFGDSPLPLPNNGQDLLESDDDSDGEGEGEGEGEGKGSGGRSGSPIVGEEQPKLGRRHSMFSRKVSGEMTMGEGGDEEDELAGVDKKELARQVEVLKTKLQVKETEVEFLLQDMSAGNNVLGNVGKLLTPNASKSSVHQASRRKTLRDSMNVMPKHDMERVVMKQSDLVERLVLSLIESQQHAEQFRAESQRAKAQLQEYSDHIDALEAKVEKLEDELRPRNQIQTRLQQSSVLREPDEEADAIVREAVKHSEEESNVDKQLNSFFLSLVANFKEDSEPGARRVTFAM